MATVSVADRRYDAAVADLENARSSHGRGRLDKDTIAIVEHNLQIIDQAIAQARQALAADPANALSEQPSVRGAAPQAGSAAARRRALDRSRTQLTNDRATNDQSD